MKAESLRAFIGRYDLTQVQFARLVDVSPSAVAQWLSEARGIPGPVGVYLRLFAHLPAPLVRAELDRAKDNPMILDGMYIVEFSGSAGKGLATLTFKNGVVYGFDAGGGIYDGTAAYDPTHSGILLDCNVKMKAGAPSVVGGIVNPFDWILNVKAVMDPKATSDRISVVTNIPNPATGKLHEVYATYRRVRDLPVAA